MQVGYTLCAKITEPKSVSEPEYRSSGSSGILSCEGLLLRGMMRLVVYTLPYKIYREIPHTT